MNRATAVVLAGVVGLSVGCSKDPDFETFPAATKAPATAAPVSEPTSVESIAPTVPPTEAPTTTAAPTTTTIPLEDQVRAAAESFVPQYSACLSAPAECDPSTFTRGEALANMTSTVTDMVDVGYFSGPGDEPKQLKIESIVVDESGSSATVITCTWDTAVVFGPPVIEGGEPTIVNDLKATVRERRQFSLEDGVWMAFYAEQIGEMLVDVNQCAG